jgi:phage tail-like protein
MSASFLERFLANPEGLLTTLEGLVADAQVFWDTRTAPSEALDWLASWIGLVLDPTWSDYQRRLLISHAPDFYARRGTVTGLMQAIRLALEPEAGPVIFEGEYDDYPGAATAVRIVERFRTRRLPGVALGDPTETAGPAASADPLAVARERAHRFTVLLPSQVCVDGSPRPSSDIAAQVERLVAAEKPAHTWFAVKRYWAMFRVGEVRVGLDTRLGEGGRFETIRLGETALAEGALAAMYPFNLSDRTVVS